MSQVIEDMDLGVPTVSPYYVLSNALILGIFSNKSTVTYSNTQIKILTREQLGSGFQLVIKIIVYKSQFSLQSYLMKNGQYFIVNSAELRKNMYRAFIKTNFQPKLKILINQQGIVSLKMHTFLTNQLQFKQTKQIFKIYGYIQRFYKINLTNFRVAFQKLKLILQPVYQKTICTESNKLERLDIIKNICRFTYVQPSFMKKDRKRSKNYYQKLEQNFIQEDELCLSNIFDLKVQSDKVAIQSKYKLFMQIWQEPYNIQKVGNINNLIQIKNMLKTNQNSVQPKQIAKIDPHQEIFAQIHVANFEKIQWAKIYQGGFGNLYKGNVSFIYQRKNQKDKKITHQKPVTKVMVMKTDRINNIKTSRIDIQRIVLKSLQGKKCRYLPKFYETKQKHPDFLNFILTDFYYQKSLEHWLKNVGQLTSIFTKFNILIFICYGLLFLNQNNIIHRDLKISNILMDSKMVIKITDFGQSYHPNLDQYIKSKGRDGKPGLTLPYAPPEIFIKNNFQPLKKPSYDMFSFGFIIFQIIFGRRLLYGISQAQLKKDYIKQAQENINQNDGEKLTRYKSIIKQRIYLAAEQIAYFGPIEIISPILNIIERCLDPNAQNRPHLQWVLGIIKQIYNSLLDFYSL